MIKLEKVIKKNIREKLDNMTLWNLIKASLISYMPDALEKLGFEQDKKRRILADIFEETGISSGTYPFYSPLEQSTLESHSLEEPSIGDQVRHTIRDKYTFIGTALAYLDFKLNTQINQSTSRYYLFVSNQLDLIRALVGIQQSLGKPLELPVVREKLHETDPRVFTHLFEGTQTYALYRRVLGDTSISPTPLEEYLRRYPIDGVVVVTPSAGNQGISTMVYRRKSPLSIADKFAYAVVSYLINRAYMTIYPRKALPTTRMQKYQKYENCHVRDILGMSVIYSGFESFPALVEQKGLGSLLVLREEEIIPTGEKHWDYSFSNYANPEFSLGMGRAEIHGFRDITHWLQTQLVGPTAHGVFKNSRMRELDEANPRGRKVENAYNLIRTKVLDILMPGIELASYPDSYFRLKTAEELQTPNFQGMQLNKGFINLEGGFSLFNPFPYSPKR